MDMFEVESPKDLKKERRVVLESRDENDYKVTQKDTCPYGHWYISRDKGQIPEQLKGAYTSFERALADVKIYLNSFNVPKKIREIVK